MKVETLLSTEAVRALDLSGDTFHALVLKLAEENARGRTLVNESVRIDVFDVQRAEKALLDRIITEGKQPDLRALYRWRCFSCQKLLTNAYNGSLDHEWSDGSGHAIRWVAQQGYGSELYDSDSTNDPKLEIRICDDCVKLKASLVYKYQFEDSIPKLKFMESFMESFREKEKE